jgi:hypothetical protein
MIFLYDLTLLARQASCIKSGFDYKRHSDVFSKDGSIGYSLPSVSGLYSCWRSLTKRRRRGFS